MNNELHRYLEILRDWNNPIYYSLLLGLILIAFLLINYYRFYLPSKKRHIFEKMELKFKNRELELKKKQLEFEHMKILATLSDTDPNPIIRVDINANIFYKNTAAGDIFSANNSLYEILPNCQDVLTNLISNGLQLQDKIKWEKRYYNYYLRGISSLGVAQVTLFDLTTRMIYAKKLSQQRNKYKSLSLYLQDNLEKEKQRIGMELHDSICQNMYLMKLKINNFMNDDHNYKKNFCEIDSVLDSTITELREIIFDLKPKIIEDLGLFNAVQVLSENISATKKITGSVDYLGEIKSFDLQTEVYLFRIIQEALNNIIKHSEANEFVIQFVYADEYLIIMVSDNGHGFETSGVNLPKNNGLLNMSERIKALNGNMSVKSTNQGTIVKINIPYVI